MVITNIFTTDSTLFVPSLLALNWKKTPYIKTSLNCALCILNSPTGRLLGNDPKIVTFGSLGQSSFNIYRESLCSLFPLLHFVSVVFIFMTENWFILKC